MSDQNKAIEDFLRDILRLGWNPEALRMTGPNKLSDACPTAGVFPVVFWGDTKQTVSRWHQGKPSGWDNIPEGASYYIIAAHGGDLYAVLTDSECYTPLYPAVSDGDLEEAAQTISEAVENGYFYY